MATKNIYSGLSRGLYRPHQFLIFMDQGESGSLRRTVELLDFKYSTSRVSLEGGLKNQIWHVHHYGVTVHYRLENEKVTVELYGEDIPLQEQGILAKSPIGEVERIIIEESKHPRYVEAEKETRQL